MFKTLQIFILVFVSFSLYGQQSYFTDFEEFEAGEYIAETAPEWFAQQGSAGTPGDAAIVNDKSKSGSNSLYMSDDNQLYVSRVFLSLGQEYETGSLNVKYSIFVEEGKTGSVAIGSGAPPYPPSHSELVFHTNEFAQMSGYNRISTPYKPGEWVDVEYQVDLDNKYVNLYLNGVHSVSYTTFYNPTLLDFRGWPNSQNEKCGFWIDDLGYEYTQGKNEFTNELMVSSFTGSYGNVGETKSISAQIINKGNDFNGNIAVKATYSGQTASKDLSNVTIAAGAELTVTLEDAFTLVEGMNEMELSIDPDKDEDETNNKFVSAIFGAEYAPEKTILVEGNFRNIYPSMPEGIVFLDEAVKNYGDKIATIYVHGEGVMQYAPYDSWLRPLVIDARAGIPAIYVDRDLFAYPSGYNDAIFKYLTTPASATLDLTMKFDEGSDTNGVAEITVNALTDIPEGFKLAFILSENNVNGGLGYELSNRFSGNRLGQQMGGFELKKDPVPAADMFYQDVARDIIPQPNGLPIGEAIAAGESYILPIKFKLDEKWVPFQMSATAILINTEDIIDNVSKKTFEETGIFISNKNIKVNNDLNIYPNPSDGNAIIALDYDEATNVKVTILDISGKTVLSKDFGSLIGKQTISLNNLNLNSGIYSVVLKTDKTISTQKLIVR